MGYFPNGTEGMAYYDAYCSRCVHDREYRIIGANGCFIWASHLLENYKSNDDHWIHKFIPRSKDGIGNEKCVMFFAGEGDGIEKLCLCGQKTWEEDGICRTCKLIKEMREVV